MPLQLGRREFLKSTIASGVMTKGATAAGQQSQTSAIRPLRIDFGPDRIRDLYRRIDATRLPDSNSWANGVSLSLVRETLNYWRSHYDWDAVQTQLNQLPNYQATLDGENLHFVHFKAEGEKQGPPLLLLHGWPSSFVEFTDPGAQLCQGMKGAPPCDVIIPSLPGYALSDPPKVPGMSFMGVAERVHRLMETLGYARYGLVGVDQGMNAAMHLARVRAESIVGLHIPSHSAFPEIPNRTLTAEEEAFVRRWRPFEAERQHYQNIQRYEAQTLAVALQDSPAGFLAWVLQRYWDWTDHGPDLWASVNRDKVLTTAMIYWLPGRILSASLLYQENMEARRSGKVPTGPITVPTWITRNPRDPWAAPESMMDRTLFPKLVNYVTLKQGGHFPALEHPDVFAEDVSAFFSRI